MSRSVIELSDARIPSETQWRGSSEFWNAALGFAIEHGWHPMGTRGGGGYAASSVSGFKQEAPIVSTEDAHALGQALCKALAAIPDVPGRPRLFCWQYRQHLRSLADFALRGSFQISWR